MNRRTPQIAFITHTEVHHAAESSKGFPFDTLRRKGISGCMFSARQALRTLTGDRLRRLRRAAEVGVSAVAIWPILLLLYVFCVRLTYPFDLEWCEGGTVYEAYRLIHGLPLYLRGDPTWAPFPYPPAHTALLGLVGLLKLDFWTARLVSIGFFGLMCWVLFRDVCRHAHRRSYGVVTGLLVVAIIACGFPVVGQWYDLARVDTMMMALSVLGISRLSSRNLSVRNIATTAAILTAAVFTKQTAVFFVTWACLFAIVREPKFGLRLSVTTLALCLLLLGVLQWITHGGLWFWTVTNLQKQQVYQPRLLLGLRNVWSFAPFVVVIPLVALWLAAKRRLSEKSLLWTGSLLVALPASLLPFAKAGGYLNNLMPLLVLLAPVTAFLAMDLANCYSGMTQLVMRGGVVAGLAWFIGVRPLNCTAYIPSSSARRAAHELNALAASLEGGLVVPYFAFLPARSGQKNLHWHRMVILDAQWRGEPMSEIGAFEQSGAHWVLLNSYDKREFETYVRSNFRLAKLLPHSAYVKMTTGEPAGVNELWEKKPMHPYFGAGVK
jgi:hypothetical protein